jgi:hypothetical protein
MVFALMMATLMQEGKDRGRRQITFFATKMQAAE